MPHPWRSFREWLAEEEKLGQAIRIKTPLKCGDPDSIVDAVPADLREEQMRVIRCFGANGKMMESEMRALVRYLHSLPNAPIGIIEKPINNRPDIPVVVNPWADRNRILRMCGVSNKEELCRKLQNLKNNLLTPRLVPRKDAPVKEVVIREVDIDLYRDAPRNWVEFETIPWSGCGGGQFIINDPESRTHDLAIWRTGFFEWDNGDVSKPFPEEWRKRYMCCAMIYDGPIASDGGMYYRDRFKKINKPMPAAYAMCNDPGIVATSAVRSGLVWPKDGIDEYAVAGGFNGMPVEVVESETIPGLMVPAQAEYVIEGEFLPEDYLVPKYAEGVYQGHLTGGDMMPIFRIKCITHRKNPLWMTTWSGSGLNHAGPHTAFADLFFEAEAINYLRHNDYMVQDLVAYDMETIIVQTSVDGAEKSPHYGKTLLSALYACPHRYIGNSNKYYIAVGPDINPYDLRDVIWALGTRVQPVSDSIIIQDGLCAWGDPSGLPGPLGWRTYGQQMLIDALIKVPERRQEWDPRTEPVSWEKRVVEKMRQKLGH
ncbi:MAG: UbiD family decarboxylase [Acidobacteria bacterium]|nr:UbiD family decarboxylase [Acidobacteriota bacterium]